MDEKKKHVAASNGFIWGLIIGGGLMYLVSTKNGRKILKELSEGGWDKLHDVIDMDKLQELKNAMSEEFEEVDEEEFEGVEQEAKQDIEKKNERSSSRAKRIFRGVRRKK